MTRLLVTGALGHIGSAFLRSLPADPAREVLLVDNLSTQRYPSLFDLPRDSGFRFIEGDILGEGLDRWVEGADLVVHLAAITNAAGSFEIQHEVEQVNFEGTRRVAEACVRHGARLMFLSTTSVYGTATEVVDEDCPESDLKPQSPYAESKLKSERLLDSMRDRLRFVTLRFGTIFGSSIGMRFHTAINKFVWQACMGQPITVWRTALHQKRPYLDLVDGVRCLNFVMERDLFDGRIYNVLTVNATVNDIVEIIREHVATLAVTFVDSKIMNQLSYEVARERIEKAGFTFEGDLRRGIGETVRLLAGVAAAARPAEEHERGEFVPPVPPPSRRRERS